MSVCNCDKLSCWLFDERIRRIFTVSEVPLGVNDWHDRIGVKTAHAIHLHFKLSIIKSIIYQHFDVIVLVGVCMNKSGRINLYKNCYFSETLNIKHICTFSHWILFFLRHVFVPHNRYKEKKQDIIYFLLLLGVFFLRRSSFLKFILTSS